MVTAVLSTTRHLQHWMKVNQSAARSLLRYNSSFTCSYLVYPPFCANHNDLIKRIV